LANEEVPGRKLHPVSTAALEKTSDPELARPITPELENQRLMKMDLRRLPSLVMHPILVGALLVIRVAQPIVEHLRFVEQFVVEAENFLVLRIVGGVGRRHDFVRDRNSKTRREAQPKNLRWWSCSGSEK
jgi:hypothetical protein